MTQNKIIYPEFGELRTRSGLGALPPDLWIPPAVEDSQHYYAMRLNPIEDRIGKPTYRCAADILKYGHVHLWSGSNSVENRLQVRDEINA
jgi:hypothetical protein